ncbi:MAG: leucyl/phenylalanyl-tRNA--protein transferase [Deltaproteobacteria bacterium RIFOXYB12_FULL_58_9]|nr:MAG: leucyl/phenylalanyl-tRNA--protein transferase [Deltaproteobacteria bacterium RIFOXYB12_FULL_58_9]
MSRVSSIFPDPNSADADGLVAVSMHMPPDLLLDAYSHGIFPWSDRPVRWYSPDPRAVFRFDQIHVPRKIRRWVRNGHFHVSADTAFPEVMQSCASAHGDTGTWISDSFLRNYAELYRLGHAHSIEVWQGVRLVGGIYGIQIGAMFAGESMFYQVSNASKVAFAVLVDHLQAIGVTLFDAQVLNDFTQELGAILLRRREFLSTLGSAVATPTPYAGRRWPATPLT